MEVIGHIAPVYARLATCNLEFSMGKLYSRALTDSGRSELEIKPETTASLIIVLLFNKTQIPFEFKCSITVTVKTYTTHLPWCFTVLE